MTLEKKTAVKITDLLKKLEPVLWLYRNGDVAKGRPGAGQGHQASLWGGWAWDDCVK